MWNSFSSSFVCLCVQTYFCLHDSTLVWCQTGIGLLKIHLLLTIFLTVFSTNLDLDLIRVCIRNTAFNTNFAAEWSVTNLSLEKMYMLFCIQNFEKDNIIAQYRYQHDKVIWKRRSPLYTVTWHKADFVENKQFLKIIRTRVSHFRIYFFFASKRNEAKQKPFRFLFASFCETKTIIFRFVSLPFASIFSLCFASLFQFLL